MKPREITEPIQEVEKDESVDDVPMKGRSTIRRDRGLVRLRTTRLRSRSKSPPPKVEVNVEPVRNKDELKPKVEAEPVVITNIEEKTDIDPGYGSSERSSGSWRTNFEGELDLYDRKVTSPTAKTPGESFFEKYHIKSVDSLTNMHYLTLDDVPIERRDSVRRRSGGKLPSFKEICSDISSDKLTDDLNAGDLRRRASLIIEEEINKIRQSESGTMMCTLEQLIPDIEDRKSRKVKKIRQKITAKSSIENPDPIFKAVIGHVEIEETAFSPVPDVIVELSEDAELRTFNVPLRKKKKLETVACDQSVSPAPTSESAEMKTPDAVVNIKTKNADLDSKLLLDEVNEAAGEVRKVKKAVKTKSSKKLEVQPKMNPLKRDPSADDFWGQWGSRETTVFTRRKQLVIDEQKKLIETWQEEGEQPVEKKIAVDKKRTSVKITSLDLNTKVQHAKAHENKSESLQAVASVADNMKIPTNKSSSSEKLDVDSTEVTTAAVAKVTEPKVEQKCEEDVTKINKSLGADKVSEAKKIGENAPQESEKKDEKVFKLQPVPKPSKLSIEKKSELEKVAAPKSPPWKLAKKVEEKLPESPKSPAWKIQKKIDEKVLEKIEEKPKIEALKVVPENVKIEAKVELTMIEEKSSKPLIEKIEVKTEPKSPKSLKTAVNDEKLEMKVDSLKKVQEKLAEAPKSPPWKLQKKIEEKAVDSPKLSGLKASKSGEIKTITEDIKAETNSKISPEVGATKIETKVAPKIEAKISPKNSATSSNLKDLKKADEKLPEISKISTEKIPEKVKEKSPEKLKVSHPKIVKDENVKVDTKVDKPKEVKPETELDPKVDSTKKVAEKVSGKLSETKAVDQLKDAKLPKPKEDSKVATAEKKLSPKSKATKVTTAKILPATDKSKALTGAATSNKSDQSTNDASNVNDRAEKCDAKKKPLEGQILESEETKVLNETKNMPAQLLNTDEPKLVNIGSKKNLGTLSKFPTLNNLSDIALNETIADNQQQHTDRSLNEVAIDNKTIDGLIEKASEAISVASAAAKEESESESEESSYESSEESSEEMEKKPFDPQRKVKIDISQMRKCYGKDEAGAVYKLVARPRPLWKIKRNRHAVFSESETESSGDETRSTAGDSAGGSSSHSSTHSDIKPKKKDSGKGDEISSEHITALMPGLNVQDGDNGDESIDSEGKKKNRLSTTSQDSGFCAIGATAAKSPRKALGEFASRFARLSSRLILIIT